MGKKKGSVNLGRTLMKDKRFPKHESESYRHTSELNDGSDWAKLNLRSVTEQTNLDDFLSTAELAGTEFTAEKENVKIIAADDSTHLLSDRDRKDIQEAQEKYQSCVRIPRRPKWDESTTPEVLGAMERESFLNWRRSLAELQEKEHILMTPYEKNLEFWKQLWRVVERSDVIVQILDARNPLLFRCEDLEEYVKEVESHKINALLLNKADLLTTQQREHWADYFEKKNIPAAFYSALLATDKDEVESPSSSKDDIDESGSSESDDGGDEADDEESENSAGKSGRARIASVATTESSKGKILSRTELADFWKSIQVEKTHTPNVLTVGLVGYPNVGKSSTINSLLQEKKVSVSATPGKTKHFQTLMLNDDLCLCDCPGLVFPSFVSTKAEMLLNGILPIDQMTYCVPPIALLTSLIPRHVFEEKYGIALSQKTEVQQPDEKCTTEELLNAYGYARGFMTQRGLPDVSRAARYILKDFVNGKLLFCTAPPTVDQNEFQIFPKRLDKEAPTLTPAQLKLLKQDKRAVKDMEEAFFKKINLHAHKKVKGPATGKVGAASDTSTDKPWKKHNNRNKREKLRRVYSELDQ